MVETEAYQGIFRFGNYLPTGFLPPQQTKEKKSLMPDFKLLLRYLFLELSP